jgi:DNA mismatch endonuclease (patch repair protein)
MRHSPTDRLGTERVLLTTNGRRQIAVADYPFPSTPYATTIMKANPSRNTGPELRLRSLLHASGLRYRVNYPIRADERRPIVADIAFTRVKLAVFVDGCFWHACPLHGTVPRANLGYWGPKLRRTAERDRETSARLDQSGWLVWRVWEHQEPREVLAQITAILGRAQSTRGTRLGNQMGIKRL